MLYDDKSKGSIAYIKLSEEFIKNNWGEKIVWLKREKH
jgi:hypothetical protein